MMMIIISMCGGLRGSEMYVRVITLASSFEKVENFLGGRRYRANPYGQVRVNLNTYARLLGPRNCQQM